MYSSKEVEDLLQQFHQSNQSMMRTELDQFVSMVGLLMTQPLQTMQEEQGLSSYMFDLSQLEDERMLQRLESMLSSQRLSSLESKSSLGSLGSLQTKGAQIPPLSESKHQVYLFFSLSFTHFFKTPFHSLH